MNTPVKKNPFEMPLQPKLDLLLQVHEEALKFPAPASSRRSCSSWNEHQVLCVTRGLPLEQSLSARIRRSR